MSMAAAIILASGSAIRAELLRAVGIEFSIVRPSVDEEALKVAARQQGESLAATAQRLADAKALSVAAPGAFVIGSDQIMAFEGRGYDKPKSLEEAKARLASLSGKSHSLINAISVARDGKILFRNLEEPVLHMRPMTDAEIDRYLAAAGAEVLSSVGAYQVEALGARLFERIDGDYFAVLGLSLYPLLRYLRTEGALAF